MKIVSRPQRKVVIQLREFDRPKKGGGMKLTQSRTLTLHDIDLATIYQLVERALAALPK